MRSFFAFLACFVWLAVGGAAAQQPPAAAERALREAVAANEAQFGRDDPRMLESLQRLQIELQRQGRRVEVEELMRRRLAIAERHFGPNSVETGRALSYLADELANANRLAEADPLARRALAVLEARLGPENREVVGPLLALASVSFAAGRQAEAEPLLRRAIALEERAAAPNVRHLATALQNLAVLRSSAGNPAEAEALYRRALALRAGAPEFNPLDVVNTRINLVRVVADQKRFAEADALAREIDADLVRLLGADNPRRADVMRAMSASFYAQQKLPEAIDAARQAAELHARGLPADHPSTAASFGDLAELYALARMYPEALAASRRASEITRAIIARSPDAMAQRLRYRGRFLRHMDLALVSGPQGGARPVAESFEIAQLIKVSGTAQALAGTATAFATRSGELAALVREHQQNGERMRALEGALTQFAGLPSAARNRANEQAVQAELAQRAQRFAETQARLARDFPQYAELADPAPMSSKEVAALLRADEALLNFQFTAQHGFLWIATKERVSFRLLAITRAELDAAVRALRSAASKPGEFPVAQAHELYKRLLGSAETELQGKQHLILVLDGALESLPLGMLVTEPVAQPANMAGYSAVPWLAKKYVTSVLPSVSSLRLMRNVIVKTPRAPLPFIGFGDAATGAAAVWPAGARPGQAALEMLSVASGFAGAGVNLEALRAARALPETADELRSIARSLGASDDKVFLRERFTKPAIVAAPLDQYRVVAFSTHGAVAGEMRGVNEPFLLLTPPARLLPNDDGMLRASDVARLRLNADWVLLSACNTAASDGTPGAEGLSGLAKAFLSAGTRSVLVSHWAVESSSAFALVTRLFAISSATPGLARTGALRRAMLELMATPRYAHPLYWAPFVLVGEGVVSG